LATHLILGLLLPVALKELKVQLAHKALQELKVQQVQAQPQQLMPQQLRLAHIIQCLLLQPDQIKQQV
jgi:hypothetical protein